MIEFDRVASHLVMQMQSLRNERKGGTRCPQRVGNANATPLPGMRASGDHFSIVFGEADPHMQGVCTLSIAFFQRNSRDEFCRRRCRDGHPRLIPVQRGRCTDKENFPALVAGFSAR
jgi:hypothetical protein